MRVKKIILGQLLFIVFSGLSAQAQSTNAFGHSDPSHPAYSQFEYYRGQWKSSIEMRQSDGTFKKLAGGAYVVGRYLDDHKTFQSQFTTPDGFFSTDIRAYNMSTQQWEALFLNANDQRWHQFTSKLLNGKMTTLVKGGYSGKEAFDLKIIDTQLSSTQMLKEVFKSWDQSQSWILTYRIRMTRISE